MSFPLFDGHCDTVYNMMNKDCNLKANELHLDLDRAMTGKYSPYAQFFAIWDMPEANRICDIFDSQYNKLITELDKNSSKIILCKSAKEAYCAFQAGKAAAFISIEGAHLINCELELLEKVYDKGVRALNITWNNSNILSGSHNDDPDRGLSDLGRQFVLRCNRLGIIIDVSHLSEFGFWDVNDMTLAPIIASHSNSRKIFEHTRNLSDEQFQAIIKHNGVAGLNLYSEFIGNKQDISSLLKHVLHFLELGGEKNISLGTDFDGCDKLCKGINGVQDMNKIYDAMLSARISEKITNDIFFNNLMRVVNDICVM